MGLVVALSGCSFGDSYEKALHDLNPVYCYQTLAGVQCHSEPNHSAQRRLVNYFGLHPSRYDAPKSVPAAELNAPPPVPFWVRDPEPVPELFIKLSRRSQVPGTPKPVVTNPRLPTPVSGAD